MRAKPVAAALAALLALGTVPSRASDGSEIALRALLAIADQPIKPEAQHCNFGSVYLHSHSGTEGVTVGEALLGELAEMDNGLNRVEGTCHGKKRMRCTLHLWHQHGEELSSTEFRFEAVDGKALIDTLLCVSSP